MTSLGDAIKSSGLKGKIENHTCVPEKVSQLLNKQLTNELYSAMLYSCLASYLDDNGHFMLSKKFLEYSKEEIDHMYKIQSYLYSRNVKVETPYCDKPSKMPTSLRDVFVMALEHEIGVTYNWNDIGRVAISEADIATLELSTWFSKEQVEEEEKQRNILYLFNMGIPEWELEKRIYDML